MYGWHNPQNTRKHPDMELFADILEHVLAFQFFLDSQSEMHKLTSLEWAWKLTLERQSYLPQQTFILRQEAKLRL